ncbi:hypothetical protein B0A49_01234 [Cryomyces minteri]|uniref:Uncharacterized protein n=1 Tax=Cryomyces minteri TaxID=331657 RepID=A0A4U0XM19_9PEZI|nr:hypothetical protein B0A49_01234 [Cryomyces minteri]
MRTVLMWSLTACLVTLSFGLYILLKLRGRARVDPEAVYSATNEKELYADNPDRNTTHSVFEENARSPVGAPLPDSITASDAHLIDRAAWVLRMTHHVFQERHHGLHNVVVINKELEYHFTADGIVESFSVDYFEPPKSRVVPYEIVVFREGLLINMGDGGDINWDWQGNFTRSGNKMLTFRGCERGVDYKQDPWVAV